MSTTATRTFLTSFLFSNASLFAATACLLLLAFSGSAQNKGTTTLCSDGSDKLCSTLPVDMSDVPVGIGYVPNTNDGQGALQPFLDYFGWQMFVALNWPADAEGKPLADGSITDHLDAPRVWQSFRSRDDAFGNESTASNDCSPAEGRLQLGQDVKMSEFIEAFTPYPLIDVDGNFVLYDIRMNDREYQYLKSNDLLTRAGQQKFGTAYDFPAGGNGQPGALEMKSAWRILADQEEQSAFFTVKAQVHVPAENTDSGEALCFEATVGLVGMHIMQKFSHPQEFREFWAWATFEHTANAPLADGAPVSPMNDASDITTLDPPDCTLAPDSQHIGDGSYSFYNPACTHKGEPCPVNQPPELSKGDKRYKWADKSPYAAAYRWDQQYGTQVARCWKPYRSADTVSHTFQAALGESVWKNYRLIGVQWATSSSTAGPSDLTKLHPFPAPIYLANTTLETYVQVNQLLKERTDGDYAPGSCISCHSMATDTAGNDANLSFLPGAAR